MSEKEQRVRDALELLREVASKELPAGYRLSLHVDREEAWLELENPDGEYCDTYTKSCGWLDAIDIAIEDMRDRVEDD